MKPHPRLKSLSLPIVLIALVGGVAYWSASYWGEAPATPTPTDPEAALTELRGGNLRFVNSRRTHSTDTRHDADHRELHGC